ncbi:hypothetical protein N665_0557s0036 [Sinapis alba]|nr:hypothetical protein N665_0557s0036 [Sinapis alba]
MEFPKASKSVVAATAGGSRSGKGADWRSGTQQAPVSDGASLLPVSGSSRSGRSGKSGGSYVIKFPNNEETTLSAKGKLSVTGAKSAHITGVGVESPLNRGCELGFPQGGSIYVLPDGLVHVIGYPQFPAPQRCLISVPDGVVVKFYAVGEDNIDAYFYEALTLTKDLCDILFVSSMHLSQMKRLSSIGSFLVLLVLDVDHFDIPLLPLVFCLKHLVAFSSSHFLAKLR